MKMPSEPTRAYLYNIAIAVGALLAGLGLVSGATLPLALGLVQAVLGLGLARANVSRK